MAVKAATAADRQLTVSIPPAAKKADSKIERTRAILASMELEIFAKADVTDCVLSYLQYLDWTERPLNVQTAVSRAFQSLVGRIHSEWGIFNGSAHYRLCSIDEHAFVKAMILEAPATRKDFYFLDIGAGEFQWSYSLRRYILEKMELPSDVTVHIIGVRGETYGEQEVVTAQLKADTHTVKLYKFGGFKIEELESEFRKRGLNLENSVDLAVSRWCMRHLEEPVGTFVQIRDLLRPKTGMLLTDGFYFLSETQSLDQLVKGDPDQNMVALLNELGAPFLMEACNDLKSMNHYAILKADREPCQLDMSYAGMETETWGTMQLGLKSVTRFKKERQDQLRFTIDYADREKKKTFIYGDKELFDWFKSRGLFVDTKWNVTTWQPLKPYIAPAGSVA